MKISMVINTYNRGNLLEKNFQRLKQLTIPDEIIVVDDGGNDETEKICQKHSKDLPIRYIYNKNRGVTICSLARNIGVKQSSHDWIVTCEPELFYLNDIIPLFKKVEKNKPYIVDPNFPNKECYKAVISCGNIWFQPKGESFDDFSNWEKAGDYRPPDKFKKQEGWVAPYTALWKKSWIEAVGGWDEEFPGNWGWDDIDILTRMDNLLGVKNYIALECSAIHQYHGVPRSDKDFVNEKYWRSKFTEIGGKGREYEQLLDEDCIANKGKQWGIIKN